MKFPNDVAAFGNFVITDVFAFSQVFVWIGDGANEVEKSDSVTVAMVTLPRLYLQVHQYFIRLLLLLVASPYNP